RGVRGRGVHGWAVSEARGGSPAAEAKGLLLEEMLGACRARGLLKTRARLRTDSTHVLAATRDLNRLELVGETLRATLNALATVALGWLRQQAPPERFDRYAQRDAATGLAAGHGATEA